MCLTYQMYSYLDMKKITYNAGLQPKFSYQQKTANMKLGFALFAFVLAEVDPKKKLDSEEKGPRQCGKIKLADNPEAGGLQIECKSRNGKPKNPNRTKRCKCKFQ